MPTLVPSTYKLLMQKAFDLPLGENVVDWAIEMIETGYESANLYMLAGETKPFNQFEMRDLTDKVLQDLHLSYSDKNKVAQDYAHSLINASIQNPATYFETLEKLKEIYLTLDMDAEYTNFYSLYFAKDDLNYSEHQWYREGATRENIDAIIKNEFQKFIDKIQIK